MRATYRRNLPIAMLVSEMGMLARIRPSATVMAEPRMGTKAKNPIHVGHHIDTILKVAKIFNIECDVVCR